MNALFLKLFDQRSMRLSPMGIACVALVSAIVAGYVAVRVGVWADTSTTKLLLLPIGLVGLLWLALDKASLFLFIMMVRGSIDRPLENFKIGNSGFGAVFNALMILLLVAFVAENPKKFVMKVAPMWTPFILIGLYATWHAPDRARAMTLFLGVCSCVAVFTIPLYVKKLKVDMRLCVWIMLLSTVFPVFYGVYEISRTGIHGIRLNSTFFHENIFAFYLVLVLSLSFLMLKAPSIKLGPRARIAIVGWMGILVIMLALTGTRSAWAGFVFLFVSYGVFIDRRYLLYLVIGAVILAFVPQVQERFSDLLAPARYVSRYSSTNSFAWRLNMWSSGLHWLPPSDYLLGKGLESFYFYSTVFNPLVMQNGAHSVYVETFFEMGVVGVLAAAWLFYSLFKKVLASYRERRVETTLICTIIVAYLLFCISDNMYSYLVFNWSFAFVMGTFCGIVSADRLRQAQPAELRGQTRAPVSLHTGEFAELRS